MSLRAEMRYCSSPAALKTSPRSKPISTRLTRQSRSVQIEACRATFCSDIGYSGSSARRSASARASSTFVSFVSCPATRSSHLTTAA